MRLGSSRSDGGAELVADGGCADRAEGEGEPRDIPFAALLDETSARVVLARRFWL
jgi:hypothetical protein